MRRFCFSQHKIIPRKHTRLPQCFVCRKKRFWLECSYIYSHSVCIYVSTPIWRLAMFIPLHRPTERERAPTAGFTVGPKNFSLYAWNIKRFMRQNNFWAYLFIKSCRSKNRFCSQFVAEQRCPSKTRTSWVGFLHTKVKLYYLYSIFLNYI